MTAKLTVPPIHTGKYLAKISKDLTCEVLAITKGDHDLVPMQNFPKT